MTELDINKKHVSTTSLVDVAYTFVNPTTSVKKTQKFVHIQFLIHISTNIYRNNTYNMSF